MIVLYFKSECLFVRCKDQIVKIKARDQRSRAFATFLPLERRVPYLAHKGRSNT
ncbi:hypothetical protein DFR47_102147 [Pseudochrobactrum asaccharolyticum]|uniref:Uncharacterized protein n=1 Tax=Pseudochrobactrum asaccharolyticum TaxID=354351 RepID=A0A366E5L1_9HYPH|nr:hypothetical protein DFR47_102147 [Pseudochrobactrum asaccharolyticum]